MDKATSGMQSWGFTFVPNSCNSHAKQEHFKSNMSYARHQELQFRIAVLQASKLRLALVLFMLVVSADTTHAERFCSISFSIENGFSNPFEDFNPQPESAPAFVDLDGDGDQDIVAGNDYGLLDYYQNSGTLQEPLYVYQADGLNPFQDIDFGIGSAPAFADLDGDGDQDVLVGARAGNLAYLQNTGTPQIPIFVQRTGTANPFHGLSVANWSKPAFADLDADGDQDAVVGEHSGYLNYFANLGTALAPLFVEQQIHPFNGVDTGVSSAPIFVDLDNDGDQDAVVGGSARVPHYFRNTGTTQTPIFEELLGAANPFEGKYFGIDVAPALADLDGDGDMDALAGVSSSRFNYFLNIGTSRVPVFVQQTVNPFDEMDVGEYSAPDAVDLDGDGDLDLVVTGDDGVIHYYENTGKSSLPFFRERNEFENPFHSVVTREESFPVLSDLDGDGDLDLTLGDYFGILNYYKNTGTARAPKFVSQLETANPFDGINVGSRSRPSFVDLDGDGDLDAVIGEFSSLINYFKNIGTLRSPVFEEQFNSDNPFHGFSFNATRRPVFADLDGDGDQDVVIGKIRAGVMTYLLNVGTMLTPVFEELSGTANPLNGVFASTSSAPEFADLDGDGDQDILIGGEQGKIKYFQNTSTALPLVFTAHLEASNPLATVMVPAMSAPTFTDLDGDGDQDGVVGNANGNLVYFKNVGTAMEPIFVEQVGEVDPFSGVEVDFDSTPVFGDLDKDGDYDLLLGSQLGTLHYFRNTGTPLSPNFIEQIDGNEPFNGVDIGDRSAPALADLDEDGDLDALIGTQEGTFHYFLNIGNAVVPEFEEQTGEANPFGGLEPGQFSAPAFADLDGDGDLDVISGTSHGDIRLFFNTGTPTALLFEEQDSSDDYFSEINWGLFTKPAFVDLNANGILDAVFGDNEGNLSYYAGAPLISAVPVISIDGGEIEVACGSSYTEYGATAHITCVGSFPATIGGDTVDPNTPGEYQVTYNATHDSIDAAQVIRIVRVLDNCPLEGEGIDEGEVTTEGILEGVVEGWIDGAAEGEAVDEGEGISEGVTEGEGEGMTEGEGEGEGGADSIYKQLIERFAVAESSGNNTLTLAEVQSVLPGFTEQELDDADANGDGELSVAELLQRVGGGILVHADTNGDAIVQFTELLRLIQLYNAGTYACAENAGATEDGFSLTAPPSEPTCVLHSIDQNADKVIALGELLRGIQLYNLGGYTWCPGLGSEDGFCGP